MTTINLGSGSTGNCYLLNLGGSWIILDAGVQTLDMITEHINLNDVAFAFISHEHKDHSRLKEKLDLRGVEIVDGTNIDTFKKIEPMSLKNRKYKLFGFPVVHGTEEKGMCKCSGLIIQHKEDCILYITDFNLCVWDLSQFKFTKVFIECNYIKDLALASNDYLRTKENIYRHRELDGTINFLKTLDLTKCEEILLMHLSTCFSNSVIMASRVYNTFLIKTGICKQKGGIDYYG